MHGLERILMVTRSNLEIRNIVDVLIVMIVVVCYLS